MTKKKTTTSKPETKPEIIPVDQEPQPEIPESQIEEAPVENQVEPSAESKEPEPTTTVEPAKAEQQAESAVTTLEPATVVEALTPKPKPLSLASLHALLEELEKKFSQQSELISQLLANPVKTRKPPVSNGKIQIKDTLTGKIYPSKNNVYQSLLKAGDLKELVEKGVFGAVPNKNSFGCYNLFRAYPGRFVEVKDAATEIPQA